MTSSQQPAVLSPAQMAQRFEKPRIEDSPKRVRVYLNGKWIIDTLNAKLVWEHQYYPLYYFEEADIKNATLKGNDIVIGDKTIQGGVEKREGSLVKFSWYKVDGWFEEDEEIFVHPRDPYKRIDVLPSSRHVIVKVNGVQVAESRNSFMLYETSLHRRIYIPKPDVRIDLLKPSTLTTQCPYKGVANYYHVQPPEDAQPVENIVWYYRTALPQVASITGYLAFYDEKVEVWVDGIKQA